MSLDNKSRTAIRDLARRVAEAAGSADNLYRRTLWDDTNSLRKPDRIPVFCELYDTWHEVLPESVLISDDPLFAGVEYEMRKSLYKYDLGDDDVIEPWIPVQIVSNLGKDRNVSLWGFTVQRQKTDSLGWVYDRHPIKDESDLEKMELPTLRYDERSTRERCARVEDLLGDILPVRRSLGPANRQWAKLHSWASALCGMEYIYLSMIDNPGFVHALMQKMMRGILSLMDECEKTNVLELNNYGRLSCSSIPQQDFDGTHVRFLDIWGRGESQEFDGVSPGMYRDFLFQYQLPILSRFGIINYGCCENLTEKLEFVKTIPNLRQFICSAWTDLRTVVAELGDRYVIEWRQSAAKVIGADRVDDLRHSFVECLRIAKGCHIQVMLDSVMTLDGKHNRLREWVRFAKELVANN
jgi:hypothetical protein